MIEDVFIIMIIKSEEIQANYYFSRSIDFERPKVIKHLFNIFLVVLFFSISHILIRIHKIENPLSFFAFFTKSNISHEVELDFSLILMLSFCIIFGEIDYIDFKTQILQYTSVYKGFHRLSKEDLFNNENRQKIIKIILNNPGIHYNLILKRSKLQSGQLQWHLNILLQYGVIKKEKFGHYIIFFPALYDEEEGNDVNIFVKSPTTMKILSIIEKEPGISSSSIAKKLKLQRNSVKYHVDKLIRENYIKSVQKGRINHLYKTK